MKVVTYMNKEGVPIFLDRLKELDFKPIAQEYQAEEGVKTQVRLENDDFVILCGSEYDFGFPKSSLVNICHVLGDITTRKLNGKEYSAMKPSYSELLPIGNNKGNIEEFNARLVNGSLILAIVGKRGSGKSTLGFRILENIYSLSNRACFALGISQNLLPNWIYSVNSIDEVHNNGIVIVDEGAISFNSRNSMTKENRNLGELLAIARHKNITLILITQNTSMMDKNVLNLCDSLLLKEGSLLQEEMERGAIQKLYNRANKKLKTIAKSERISHCYLIDDDFEGLVKVDLPSFWNNDISKNQS